MEPEKHLTCRRCGGPVRLNAPRFKESEGMHKVCFHYAFEHDLSGQSDADEDCGLDGCPAAGLRPRPTPPTS